MESDEEFSMDSEALDSDTGPGGSGGAEAAFSAAASAAALAAASLAEWGKCAACVPGSCIACYNSDHLPNISYQILVSDVRK